MRKTLAALLCITAFAASAQKIASSKVPDAVQSSFRKNFPTVKDVKWEAEKGDYEAGFKEGATKMSALFSAAGQWKETEKAIPVANLPAAAHAYIRTHHKGADIKDAAELKGADGSTRYEAEVKGTDLIFDAKGNFLKAQKD